MLCLFLFYTEFLSEFLNFFTILTNYDLSNSCSADNERNYFAKFPHST